MPAPSGKRTVGDPIGAGVRTFSLMTNRFPDHVPLYVRVEDKENNLVYATYSLGRVISFDEPHAEVDRDNLAACSAMFCAARLGLLCRQPEWEAAQT